MPSDDAVRVWLVERTYSDRKERALTSFSDHRETTAAVDASPNNLGTVDEPDLRAQYAAEAERMADLHDPDDVI